MTERAIGLSENAFSRTMATVLAHERTLPPHDRKKRRSLSSGGGSGRLTPYIITEEAYGGGSVAVFRWANAAYTTGAATLGGRVHTAAAKRATWNGVSGAWVIEGGAPEIDIYTEAMSGVAFTGQMVLVTSIAGDRRIVGGASAHLFTGLVSGTIAIDGVGFVALHHDDETLSFGGGGATVSAVNDVAISLVDGDEVAVEFHDATQVFRITRKRC